MLQQFGEEIWMVDGPTVSLAGFAYPTRMIVVRLLSGALFVWSPTALSSELRPAIDILGPVQHIVAPNTLHHIYVGEWQAAYPAAQSYAVPALRAKRPDLKWDRDLEDAPAPEWSNDIEQVVVGGNRITTEVVFSIARAERLSSPTLSNTSSRIGSRGGGPSLQSSTSSPQPSRPSPGNFE